MSSTPTARPSRLRRSFTETGAMFGCGATTMMPGSLRTVCVATCGLSMAAAPWSRTKLCSWTFMRAPDRWAGCSSYTAIRVMPRATSVVLVLALCHPPFWRPYQRLTQVRANTPATRYDPRHRLNRAMYLWGEQQSKLVLIAGHTHNPVFRIDVTRGATGTGVTSVRGADPDAPQPREIEAHALLLSRLDGFGQMLKSSCGRQMASPSPSHVTSTRAAVLMTMATSRASKSSMVRSV